MKEIQHISSLKLTNFKQFKELEVDNIGQFNLIVGDNNVGKTSLLEALLVHYDPTFGFAVWEKRLGKLLEEFHGLSGQEDRPFRYFVNANELAKSGRVSLEIEMDHQLGEANMVRVDFSLQQGVAFEFTHNGRSVSTQNNGRPENLQVPFIPAVIRHGRDLGQFYSDNIQFAPEKRKAFVESLRTLVDDLKDVEISAQTKDIPLLLSREDQDASILLAMYGEGTIKLAHLLMELEIWSRQRLMIDEIDTGIYYKRMPDFWRTLISGAEKSDVQLFATTHNKDCLDAFTRLFEREDMSHLREKARVLKMTRLPDGSVKVYPYEFAQFQNALEVQYEIR